MQATNPILKKANTLTRSDRPHERAGWDSTTRTWKVALDAHPRTMVDLTFVYFRSFGCRFDRRGECTMCNYAVAEPVSSQRIVEIVAAALEQRPHYEALGISPFGNMFDPQEVPADARRQIFELAAATDCASFHCESRPETIEPADVEECVAILAGKRVFVNLGLESADPWIQANCIGKSLDRQTYADCVAHLRSAGAHAVTNVLLGGPFLTEAEALDSAVETTSWALEQGSHLCVLFPSNVKGWTLQEWLWDRGLFRTPSLWSLVEALHRLGRERAAQVSLSWYSAQVSDPDNPLQLSDPVRAVPTTCALCHRQVVEQLDRYNAGGDFSIVEDLRASECACRAAWLTSLEDSADDPLEARVAAGYERIGRELVGSDWWDAHRAEVLTALRA